MSGKQRVSRINRVTSSTENTALWSLAGVFLVSCGGGGGGGGAPRNAPIVVTLPIGTDIEREATNTFVERTLAAATNANTLSAEATATDRVVLTVTESNFDASSTSTSVTLTVSDAETAAADILVSYGTFLDTQMVTSAHTSANPRRVADTYGSFNIYREVASDGTLRVNVVYVLSNNPDTASAAINSADPATTPLFRDTFLLRISESDAQDAETSEDVRFVAQITNRGETALEVGASSSLQATRTEDVTTTPTSDTINIFDGNTDLDDLTIQIGFDTDGNGMFAESEYTTIAFGTTSITTTYGTLTFPTATLPAAIGRGSFTWLYTLDDTRDDAITAAGATETFKLRISDGTNMEEVDLTVQIAGFGEPPAHVRSEAVTIADSTTNSNSASLTSAVLEYVDPDPQHGARQVVYTITNHVALRDQGIVVVVADNENATTFTQEQINGPTITLIRQNVGTEPTFPINSVTGMPDPLPLTLRFTVDDVGDPTSPAVEGSLNITITPQDDPATVEFPTGAGVQRVTTVDPVENDNSPIGGFEEEASGVFYFRDPEIPYADVNLMVQVGSTTEALQNTHTSASPLVLNSDYGTFTIWRDNTESEFVVSPQRTLIGGTVSFSYELRDVAVVRDLGAGEVEFDPIILRAGINETINVQVNGVTQVEFEERTNSSGSPIDIDNLVFEGQARDNPAAFSIVGPDNMVDSRFVVAQAGDGNARNYKVQLAAGATLDFDASPRIPLIIKEVNLNDAHIYAILTLTEDDGSLAQQAIGGIGEEFA